MWASATRGTCPPAKDRLTKAAHLQSSIQPRSCPEGEARRRSPGQAGKGKRRPRVIHLQGPALEIVKRLMAAHPEGKLFLNEDGVPWKRFAIANRFDRLHLALGIEVLKEKGILVPPLPRFNRRKYADPAQLAEARREHKAKLRERRKEILKLARQHSTKFAAYDNVPVLFHVLPFSWSPLSPGTLGLESAKSRLAVVAATLASSLPQRVSRTKRLCSNTSSP